MSVDSDGWERSISSVPPVPGLGVIEVDWLGEAVGSLTVDRRSIHYETDIDAATLCVQHAMADALRPVSSEDESSPFVHLANAAIRHGVLTQGHRHWLAADGVGWREVEYPCTSARFIPEYPGYYVRTHLKTFDEMRKHAKWTKAA